VPCPRFLGAGFSAPSSARDAARTEHTQMGLTEQLSMAWFYEIRNSDNAVPKRDGGLPLFDKQIDSRKLKQNGDGGM
jgi:hypothetical protein